MTFENIKKKVGDYYSGKLREYGASPKGVDWNSEESQFLRFRQLAKVIEPGEPAVLLDYGCGYGSLFEFLKKNYPQCQYTGFDVSEDMIHEARRKYGTSANWVNSLPGNATFDYTVASGIFNVKLDTDDEEWLKYTKDTLHSINRISTKGFAFNVLTKYSDAEYMRDDLYYADPCLIFDYCKKNFSRYVALLHDYPLYEFTILVKK